MTDPIDAVVVGMPGVPAANQTAREAASAIRNWAVSRNILQALPAHAEAQVVANVPPANFTEEQEALLRSRGIASIAFSDVERKVFVYLRRRLTKAATESLPDRIGGCDVLYPQGGVDCVTDKPPESQASSFVIYQAPSGSSHYACGSSVSPGNSASAGTLGLLVTDGAGKIFGVSNNHVTGSCNHSQIGLPILAPGVLDVAPGANPFTIGIHARSAPMQPGTQGNVDIFRNIDASIFEILDAKNVTSMQGTSYDTPALVEAPADGMAVEKVGRTTQLTEGSIVGQELVPIEVSLSAPSYNFHANIHFAGVWIVHGIADVFSAPGDSGSLVVHRHLDGSRSAVGLLFASGPDSLAPGKMKTLILPLEPILTALGVVILTAHNVN
jgi:hypothetical protein